MEEEYRSYQSEWQGMNAFHIRWKDDGRERAGLLADTGYIGSVENNQANRSQVLD